jgi:long-chain acyl-CoA synthetase
MLIHDYLFRAAEKFPEKEAIIFSNKRYTYKEVANLSLSISEWLRSQDLQPDFRAAILTDNPLDYVTTYFGILASDGIVVGLNTWTSHRTLELVVNDCGASILFINSKFLKYIDKIANSIPSVKMIVVAGLQAGTYKSAGFKRLEHSEVVSFSGQSDTKPAKAVPASIAQIIYTSGTTGKPKGVMLSHANLIANTKSIVKYLKLSSDDRAMAVLPFFYAYGNSILLTHISVGSTLVINWSFLYPNVILDEMLKNEVTGFYGTSATYAILLSRSAIREYQFPLLRYIAQSGSAMHNKLIRGLQKILPDKDIYIMYGQTEAAPRLSYLDPKDINRKIGSIGKAISGVVLQLLDKKGNPVQTGEVGEIVARGDNIMTGYWKKPNETATVLRPEGLRTGDLAKQDKEGYLYIVDRKDNMIKSGSHRIAPKEIEEIICEHESVHEAAVIGVKDEILGEAVKACVVLRPGSNCDIKDIIKHCRINLPAYKVPHLVEFYDNLPKTGTGKIKKLLLKF